MLSLAPEFVAGICEVLRCQCRESVLQEHGMDAARRLAHNWLCEGDASTMRPALGAAWGLSL